MDEDVSIRGNVNYVVRNVDGSVRLDFDKTNLVPTAGKALVALLACGTSVAAASNIAIGTGTTNFAATSTQLGNETKRDTATTSVVTTTVAGDTSQFVKSFSFTGDFAIAESCVLNAAATGSMLCAQTFSAINVASGDSLEMTWKVSFA